MTARNTLAVLGRIGSDPDPLVTPSDARMTLASLVKRIAGIRPKQGILRGHGTESNLEVTGMDGWSYRVKAGAVVVAPDAASGAYIVANDGEVTLATGAKPGTGSRIDIIYMGQQDAWDRGAGVTQAVLGVAQGDPGSPGAAPAIPDGTIEIARNTMTSAATSTNSAGNSISQSAGFTSAAGGTELYRSTTQRALERVSAGPGTFSFTSGTHAAYVTGDAANSELLVARALGVGSDGGRVIYSMANATGISEFNGEKQGDLLFVNDLTMYFRWNGATWRPVTIGATTSWANIATTWPTPIDGAQVTDATANITYRYFSSPPGGGTAGWKVWNAPPRSFTPTYQSATSWGSGATRRSYWGASEGRIQVDWEVVVGDSGKSFTDPLIALPVPAAEWFKLGGRKIGAGQLSDASAGGGGRYEATILLGGTTQGHMRPGFVDTTVGQSRFAGIFAAGGPFNWDEGDFITFSVDYPSV